MTRAVAALDVGSSSVKGARYEAGQRQGEPEREAIATRRDGPRVEHDPEAVARAVEAVLGRLAEDGPVAAVALACQRSTCLLWDRDGARPLTPALSWQDAREVARVERLAGTGAKAENGDAGGEDVEAEVARTTGLRLSPHYAAPKLAGLLEASPDARRRAEAGELVAGTLDAFLVHRLTGRPTTEPGCAGRTLLYDLEADAWSERLCDLFGVPMAALPELAPSVGDRGGVAAAGGTPLAAVAGDQQAALVGHGGLEEGTTVCHFGTGAFVLAACGETPRRHPDLLAAVVASSATGRRFQLEGSVNSAGAAVDWALALTGASHDDLEGLVIDPDRDPWVVPTFAGAAAPWWRPRARATVARLTLDHGPRDLLAGVLLGVAMRVVDCVETLADAGLPTRRLRVSGRLTRAPALVALLADAGGVRVEVSGEEEAGLAGVARLAAGAAGGEPFPEPPLAETREPAWPARRAADLRRRWRELVATALPPR